LSNKKYENLSKIAFIRSRFGAEPRFLRESECKSTTTDQTLQMFLGFFLKKSDFVNFWGFF